MRDANCSRVFPRSIDRGLIEARTPPGAGRPRRHFPGLLIGASLKLPDSLPDSEHHGDFPGLLIGASLKRNNKNPGRKDPFGFPRSIDRGLIEAVQSLQSLQSQSYFPGLLIGASLKPLTLEATENGVRHFPGLLIGASLKLVSCGAFHHFHDISPVY